jgi:hypothetical protein
MKLRDTLGHLVFPGTMPTGNLVWVDAVNGNDSLATRGQLSVPFKTLAKARDAAQQGDTIMVLPSTYNDYDLLRNGVNWYFFPGAIVHYTGNAGPIFATGSSGLIASVGGFGDFTADSNEVVNVSAGSGDLFIQARRMEAPDTSCIAVTAGSGTLKLQVAEKIEGLYAISKEGASACVVEADELEGSTYCINYTAGNLFVRARNLTSLSGCTVKVGPDGSTGDLVIDAVEIESISGPAVSYEGSNPTLRIRNARIKSANSYAVYVGEDEAAAYKVTLQGCVGIAGGTYSIYADGTDPVVQIPGGWACNTPIYPGPATANAYIGGAIFECQYLA